MSSVEYPAHVRGLVQSLIEEDGHNPETWLILADALEDMGLTGASLHCKRHSEFSEDTNFDWESCTVAVAISKGEDASKCKEFQ